MSENSNLAFIYKMSNVLKKNLLLIMSQIWSIKLTTKFSN